MTTLHPLLAVVFFVVVFTLGNVRSEGAPEPPPSRPGAELVVQVVAIGISVDAPLAERLVAESPVPTARLPLADRVDEAAVPPRSTTVYDSLTPDQLRDGLFLSRYEALAACGPAAAVAFARALGFDLPLDDAVAVAREVGWSPWAGMGGPRNQIALLERLGISAWLADAEVEPEIDWDRVIADVLAGNPVIVSTIGHYYVAERYDPESGAFDFGASAAVLRASGGQRWFTAEQIGRLGYGEPTAVIHLIRPGTVAATLDAPPTDRDAFGTPASMPASESETRPTER